MTKVPTQHTHHAWRAKKRDWTLRCTVGSFCTLMSAFPYHLSRALLYIKRPVGFLDHRFFGAVCTMTKRVNSSLVPKKGKARQVMKKPAMVKTKPWQDVPYTPKNALVGPRGLRTDQTKWKCTLSDLLKADNEGIVKLLVRDKLLIDMTGVTCPRCGKGTLSKLTKCQGDRWKHKCSSRNCRVWLNPHHLHPLFVDGWGNSAKALQTQSTLLLLLLHRIPQSKIHMLMDINQGC